MLQLKQQPKSLTWQSCRNCWRRILNHRPHNLKLRQSEWPKDRTVGQLIRHLLWTSCTFHKVASEPDIRIKLICERGSHAVLSGFMWNPKGVWEVLFSFQTIRTTTRSIVAKSYSSHEITSGQSSSIKMRIHQEQGGSKVWPPPFREKNISRVRKRSTN